MHTIAHTDIHQYTEPHGRKNCISVIRFEAKIGVDISAESTPVEGVPKT